MRVYLWVAAHAISGTATCHFAQKDGRHFVRCNRTASFSGRRFVEESDSLTTSLGLCVAVDMGELEDRSKKG